MKTLVLVWLACGLFVWGVAGICIEMANGDSAKKWLRLADILITAFLALMLIFAAGLIVYVIVCVNSTGAAGAK